MNDIAPKPEGRLPSLGGRDEPLLEKNLNIALEKTSSIDQWVSRGSEFFSAILVKEARQALKSRHFVWTFFLLLIIVAAWAVLSISIAFSDQGALGDLGPLMLCGFFYILGFPLAIIIPYSAFRSLAHEYENGTLQLVAVTTMKPYQIVAGKLGSAMLQMMMYLAILAPCMAFTYLLRGVDVFQITFGLLVAVSGSICLCCICLFLACGMRRRAIGIGMTVVLVPALGGIYALWCGLSSLLTFEPSFLTGLYQPESILAIWPCFALAGSTALLAFVSATSLVAFDTENRATRIRLAILFQQFLFIAFAVTFARVGILGEPTIFWGMTYIYSHYWLAIGAMLVSTRPIISGRVRRSFPKTFLGESAMGLLMPGAGRAYLFTVANMLVCAASFLLIALAYDSLLGETLIPTPFPSIMDVESAIAAVVFNFVYSFFFLSLTFLIIQSVRKVSPHVTAFFGLIIAGFLVFGGALLGVSLQYVFYPLSVPDYTIVHCFSWYVTGIEVMSTVDSNGMIFGPEMSAVFYVSVCSFILGIVCIWIASRDLNFTSLDTPERVLKERLARRRKKKAVPEETIDDIFRDLEERHTKPADAVESADAAEEPSTD